MKAPECRALWHAKRCMYVADAHYANGLQPSTRVQKSRHSPHATRRVRAAWCTFEKEKRWITLGALGQKCASSLYVKASALGWGK